MVTAINTLTDSITSDFIPPDHTTGQDAGTYQLLQDAERPSQSISRVAHRDLTTNRSVSRVGHCPGLLQCIPTGGGLAEGMARNFEVPMAGTGPKLDAEVSRCSVPGRSRFSFTLRRFAPHTDKRFVRPASKKEVHQFKNRNRKTRKENTYGKPVRTR